MDFFEVITNRHSMRAYKPDPIEPEKLQQILDAINRAPSAGNLQAYEVYVVRQAGQRMALAQASWGQDFIAQAPLALVFCTHPALTVGRYAQRGVNLYSPQDATIACTFAMLAATALELSTVWVGAFEDDAVWKVIGSPEGQTPVAILPIGYASKPPRLTPRRKLDELVHEM